MISVTTIRIAAIIVEVILLAILGLKVKRIIRDVKEHNGKNRLRGE
jgi:hypothetical protein